MGMESRALSFVKDCVEDLSSLQPGLVLHILDMLWQQGSGNCQGCTEKFIELAKDFLLSRFLSTMASVRSVFK